jgi:hypothetical protein
MSAITAPQAAVRDRLPDLVMLPPEAFHVAYEGKRKVLRFSADVMNAGSGPFDVTGVRSSAKTPTLKVTQTILRFGGRPRHVKIPATMRWSQLDGHDHFHVQKFERYRLRSMGSATWRGSHKEGFCLRDDANLRGRPSRYPDDTFFCGADEPKSLKVRQGLSEGWVDVYDWYIEGQFIELKGLHLPGNFCVSADVDPSGWFVEKTRTNNTATAVVRVTSTSATVVRLGGC